MRARGGRGESDGAYIRSQHAAGQARGCAGTASAALRCMLMPEISRYMTREPYTIPSTSTAAKAREVMRSHLIRHLPILDGIQLVGLISAEQIQALANVPGVNLEHVEVAKIMHPP